MNSISKLLFGLGIAASISGTSVAADSGVTNIDIEGGFGLKLGAKIAYEAIDSALPKESDWQVHKSYVLKDKPENVSSLSVTTNHLNEIYMITGRYENFDCDSDFIGLKEAYDIKYSVHLPWSDEWVPHHSMITYKNEQERIKKEIRIRCSNSHQSLSIAIKDVLMSVYTTNLTHANEEKFMSSLSVCETGYQRPVRREDKGWMSSNFGWRSSPFTGLREWHEEIDYAAPIDTPVYASDAGLVVNTSRGNEGYGNRITIKHLNADHTTYSHLNSFEVGKGDYVQRGELIGRVGETGRTTGPHIAFALIRNGELIDPLPFMPKREECKPVYQLVQQ